MAAVPVLACTGVAEARFDGEPLLRVVARRAVFFWSPRRAPAHWGLVGEGSVGAVFWKCSVCGVRVAVRLVSDAPSCGEAAGVFYERRRKAAQA